MTLISAAQHANSSFTNIPIIDLANISPSQYKDESREQRQALAGEIRNACLGPGFFYVRNHGIPEQTILDVLDAAQSFFALPEDRKMEVRNKTTANFKGYTPPLSANNDPNGDGDMHEGFLVGWEPLLSTSQGEMEASNNAIGQNVWPKVDGFKPAVLAYYHAVVSLGKLLFPLFALALDLPEDFFVNKTRHSAALMRLLHYPPQTGPVDDHVIGIGAHTDWECFTILYQQPFIQALQVLNADKKWIDAPPIPGTLVINLGDQFARWTNGIFKSNTHRAINRSGIERYSIPLFFGTDYDVLLEPIPGCVSEDRPPMYDVVTAGEYIQGRLKDTYS